jgi:hypothetical protein
LRGCSEKEFQRIEKRFGHRLPEAFRQLMRVIGKGAGVFMSDLEFRYPDVVTLTERIRKLIADDVALPERAFVFVDRDGDQSLFFLVSDDDPDPPIYKWHAENPKRFRKIFRSIWDFIEEELKAHESLM